MAQVTLTLAQISAALNGDGYRLGSGQFTFSIPGAGSIWPGYAAGTEPTTGYTIVTAAQSAAFRLALAGWDELILPNFTEVADTVTTRGEIRVAFTSYDMESTTAAYAYQGTPQAAGGKVGDIWINAVDATDSFARGTYGYETLIHELGHTLGLTHSFEDPAIPAPYENTRYTVMSYTEGTAGRIISFTVTGNSIRSTTQEVVAVTPMVLDIAAVQAIYGADPTTRAGDTVYTFSQDDVNFQSIYDAGGVDTIDLSNFTRANIIDLTPGAYSSIGLFTRAEQQAYWTALYPGFASFISTALSDPELFIHGDNVGIALSTVIENATGGAAADTITGNSAANVLRGLGGGDTLSGGAGNDTLEGGAGDDTLTGGAGADVFRFAATGDGVDRITDFAVAEDRFDLGGGSFTSVTEADGATTVRYAGGSVSVTGLTGLTLAQWNALVLGATTPAPPPAPTPTPTPTPTPAPVSTPQFVMIAGAGVQATVTGSGSVAAGEAGVQDITVRDAPGTITFGATFNEGGDRVHLTGAASSWTAVRSGTSVTLSDGDTLVVLPAGTGGVDLIFADGIRTLKVDSAAAAILLGSQAVTTAAAAITAPAGAATATAATDPSLAAQMLLIGTEPVTAIGTVRIAGSTTAAETVMVASGATATFGASFNAGGDTILLPGSAASYTVVRSGTTVRLVSATEDVSIPAGTVGLAVGFAGGDTRVLVVDAAAGTIKLGAQAIGTLATAVSTTAVADVTESAFALHSASSEAIVIADPTPVTADHLALVA